MIILPCLLIVACCVFVVWCCSVCDVWSSLFVVVRCVLGCANVMWVVFCVVFGVCRLLVSFAVCCRLIVVC